MIDNRPSDRDMGPEPKAMCEAEPCHHRPSISFSRRKEIMRLAGELAEQITGRVKPHELCLLRSFTEGLLDRY